MCKGGCSKRCREAAIRADWILHDDGWWRHPTIPLEEEKSFRDEDVTNNPTAVTMQRPSIRRKAIGVISEAGLEKFADFRKRLGLT
jgi:hypothetical protein